MSCALSLDVLVLGTCTGELVVVASSSQGGEDSVTGATAGVLVPADTVGFSTADPAGASIPHGR
jgi:hypothetical protein